MKNNRIFKIYKRLYAYYGPQFWWPGDTRFEIVVGAVLTQNTAWRNVEKAIRNLKAKNLLTLKKLVRLPVTKLAELIRPTGFYNLKAQRLHNLLVFLFQNYSQETDLVSMNRLPTQRLRKDLLSVKGIGEETADSILLYAFNRPVFVVDAYTRRIFSRHHCFSYKTPYSEIQRFFVQSLPKRTKIYNEYHALIVRLAKDHCKKVPVCNNCPIFNY